MTHNLSELKTFSEVIEYINTHYDYTPYPLENGSLKNKPDENQGSQKVFGFASLYGLTKEETLALFREHYNNVLSDPNGTNHQNIRQFMKHGWDGIKNIPKGENNG
jgi:hypothetical protein